MKIGIVSDVHSNLEALEVALGWLKAQAVDEIVCLGDVVGYGPDPNGCCELVRRSASTTLLGNHDAAVVGAMSTEFFAPLARTAIQWTRRQLTPEHLEWLYKLPYVSRRQDLGLNFFHAAPICPSSYFYVLSHSDAKAHMGIYNRLSSISFFGHSHWLRAFRICKEPSQQALQQHRHKQKDKPRGRRGADTESLDDPYVCLIPVEEVRKQEDARHLVSVGSVGQPRDRNPMGAVSHVDSETGQVVVHRYDYDRKTTQKKILSAGLAKRFAARLASGD